MTFAYQFGQYKPTKTGSRAVKLTPLEMELKQIFGNQIPATRSVIKRLRDRLPTDADITNHIKTLRDAGWPSWAIKETLLLKPYPPLQDILRLQKLLCSSGIPPHDAIVILAKIKCIGSMHDVDALERKIELAFNTPIIQASGKRAILLRTITFIATNDEERLRQASEELKKRDPIPTNWFAEMQKQLRKRPSKKTS